MKFLVTGASGLIGRHVVKDLVESKEEVYSCHYNTKTEYGVPIPLDLTNTDSITKVVDKVKPEVIIHLAAITNVDLCEEQKELAFKINVAATEVLAKQAARFSAFFVYMSTDYIFDGKDGMKRETDVPNPVGCYGKTKLDGEIVVKQFVQNWCITRTSTPFGLHSTKKSFPLFVAENLRAKREISAVKDQFTSPTYVPNLSRMLIEVAKRRLNGIFHLAGATRISRYDMAMMVAKKLNLDKELIKSITTSEMNWLAKRPRDSSLDVAKASSILHEKPLNVESGLDLFIREIRI